MSERVLTTIDNGIARVTLNRPDKRNGLDLAMFEALIEAGETLIDNKKVRAVVLHGEGQAFCAGLDFQWFMSDQDSGKKLLDRPASSPANLAQRVAWIWQEVPVPVIAAIHGPAFGGGCQLAMGADLRYVAPDAQFSVMEIKWGLIPDMSITHTLPKFVRLDVAKELTFTGRIVNGAEAVQLGLATRVCEHPLEEALTTARLIASKSPHAIRAGKQLFNHAPDMSVADAFKLETELQLSLIGSANNMEAVQANMMKREPAFQDPE